jgi:hypothetical protein
LMALLGRAGAADEIRLAALEALEPVVTAAEALELARINTGQRPVVLPRALEVLAATACGMALFALRKVYALRDDVSEAAARLAANLEDLLPEAQALRARPRLRALQQRTRRGLGEPARASGNRRREVCPDFQSTWRASGAKAPSIMRTALAPVGLVVSLGRATSWP